MKMPAYVTEAIDAAVEKGARRLDQRRPNWYRDIDLRTLDMDDGCLCICGQLYGEGFSRTALAKIIGGWVNRLGFSYFRLAGNYGFVVPTVAEEWANSGGYGRNRVIWNRLERRWKEAIRTRLAAEQVTT